MFVVQDTQVLPGSLKDLEKALRRVELLACYSSTGNMLEKDRSGEHLLGYNVLGSYALVRAKKDPSLGVVLPKDYTLVLSRVMFIGEDRRRIRTRPSCGSTTSCRKRGQTIIGNESSSSRSAPTSRAR